jgi:hypothetical protein
LPLVPPSPPLPPSATALVPVAVAPPPVPPVPASELAAPPGTEFAADRGGVGTDGRGRTAVTALTTGDEAAAALATVATGSGD